MLQHFMSVILIVLVFPGGGTDPIVFSGDELPEQVGWSREPARRPRQHRW